MASTEISGSQNLKLKILPDDELIRLYREKDDKSAIGELYNRYAHLLFGVCMKYLKNENDSKDALMHVFEKLFDALKNYEIASFKSWIYSVTKHHCLYVLRQDKEKAYDENELVRKTEKEFMEIADDFALNGKLTRKDDIQRLTEAIGRLKEEQRICIELFYLQEKTYEEVQHLTKFSYNEVKSYIQNGKRNLKIMLGDNHA